MAEHPMDKDIAQERAEREPGVVRYERKDLRLRLVVFLLLGAGCFAAVHYFLTWQYFGFRKGLRQEAQQSPYPGSANVSSRLPLEPRLEQLNRLHDGDGASVYDRLLAQERLLHSYGPTDNQGFVHIPIDEAIRLVAGRLPVEKIAETETGRSDARRNIGGSNSGRMPSRTTRGGNP